VPASVTVLLNDAGILRPAQSPDCAGLNARFPSTDGTHCFLAGANFLIIIFLHSQNFRYFCLSKNTMVMDFINLHIHQIKDLCRKYNVRRLSVFGSVLTDRFNSDVDLIVDFDKTVVKDHFLNYFEFKYALENVLGREVDLLEEQPIIFYQSKYMSYEKNYFYLFSRYANSSFIFTGKKTCF
jgi:predicted nucleotidyltransferase